MWCRRGRPSPCCKAHSDLIGKAVIVAQPTGKRLQVKLEISSLVVTHPA